MRAGEGYADDHAGRRKGEAGGKIHFCGADGGRKEVPPEADSAGFLEVQSVSERGAGPGQLLQRQMRPEEESDQDERLVSERS